MSFIVHPCLCIIRILYSSPSNSFCQSPTGSWCKSHYQKVPEQAMSFIPLSFQTMPFIHLECPSPTTLPHRCIATLQSLNQRLLPLYTILDLSSLPALDFVQTHIIELTLVSNSFGLCVCIPIVFWALWEQRSYVSQLSDGQKVMSRLAGKRKVLV